MKSITNFLFNFILNTDSYKFSHFGLIRPGVTNLFSYIESRGGQFKESVFFGLQMFLNEYLSKPITTEMIDEAEEFALHHGVPFNREGWETIVKEFGGFLPIEIRAVKEGTVIPVKNALVTVRATDPRFAWLVIYIETMLLRAVWYPTTVATLSREIKKIIHFYLDQTSDDPSASIGFGLLDFSARGVECGEANMIGGAAHLVNFVGSDSVLGVAYANHIYKSKMSAWSVPASEHSVTCTWGKLNEKEFFKHCLKRFDQPVISVVSDTWSIFNAVELWGELINDVRASGKLLVIRPDSGDPEAVLSRILPRLGELFGTTTNQKGFKVLRGVKVLWGDGIELATVGSILAEVKTLGFSTENIMLGSGGGLAQKVNRDTMKFAMKASAMKLDGKWEPIFKDPVTDPGKVSKKGVLSTIKTSFGEYMTVDVNGSSCIPDGWEEVLEPVFRNGKILREQTLDEIRELAKV